MNVPLMPCDLFPPQARASRTVVEAGAGPGAPSETFAAVLSTQQGHPGSSGEPSPSACQSDGVDTPVEGDGSPASKALQPSRRLADASEVDPADPRAARVSPRGAGKHRSVPLQQPAAGNALGKHFPTRDAIPFMMPVVPVVDVTPTEPAPQTDFGTPQGTEIVAEEDAATKDTVVRVDGSWIPPLGAVTPRMEDWPVSGMTPDRGIPSGREDQEAEVYVPSPVLPRPGKTPAGSTMDAVGAVALFQPAARPDATGSIPQTRPEVPGFSTETDSSSDPFPRASAVRDVLAGTQSSVSPAFPGIPTVDPMLVTGAVEAALDFKERTPGPSAGSPTLVQPRNGPTSKISSEPVSLRRAFPEVFPGVPQGPLPGEASGLEASTPSSARSKVTLPLEGSGMEVSEALVDVRPTPPVDRADSGLVSPVPAKHQVSVPRSQGGSSSGFESDPFRAAPLRQPSTGSAPSLDSVGSPSGAPSHRVSPELQAQRPSPGPSPRRPAGPSFAAGSRSPSMATANPGQDPSRAFEVFPSVPTVSVGSVSNPDPSLSREVARQIATALRGQGPSQTDSSLLVDPMPRLRVQRPETPSNLVEMSTPDAVESMGDDVATPAAPESGDARGPVAERQGTGPIERPKSVAGPRRLGSPVDAESIQTDRHADQQRDLVEVGFPTSETVSTSHASAGVRRERSILPRTAGGDRDSGISGSRNPVEYSLETVGSTTPTTEMAAGGREAKSRTDLGGNGSQGSPHQGPSKREEDSRSLNVGHPALFSAGTPLFGTEASAVQEPVGDHSAASHYSPSHWTQSPDQTASHRRMEFDTLGQGRLQLTLTQVGDALRIDAVEVGNALSGTESGWQDLQQRLEQSGVILGSLQNDSGGDRQHRERPTPDPRHAACYESGVGSSDQREHAARTPSYSSQASRGEPGAWTGSDASEGTQRLPQRVVIGREWWA